MRWRIKIEGQDLPIDISLIRIDGDLYDFDVGGEHIQLTSPTLYPFSIRTNEGILSFESWNSKKWKLVDGSNTHSLEPMAWGSDAKSISPEIRSEMPGRVLKILVKAGDQIAPHQALMVIEAMKMENEIRATSTARIKTILVTPGQSIESGAVLIELEASVSN